MDKEYKPYQPNEMWGEPGTRSFHNDAAKFFREVMKLKTPIQANNTPKCSAVRQALLSVPRDQAMTDMLFDISVTPCSNLWPGENRPPPIATGVLWQAVQDVFTSPGKTVADADTEGDDDSEDLQKTNADKVLAELTSKEKGILMDENTYFTLLQDPGFSISKKKRPQKCHIVKCNDPLKKSTMAYTKIYVIAQRYHEILSENTSVFTKLPKNKSQILTRVCKWILDNREYKGYSDVYDKKIRDIVENNSKEDKVEAPSHVYIYSQKFLFTKMFNMWTEIGIEKDEVTMNDRLRVIGIMLSPEYRDQMDAFTLGKAKTREELDDPTKRKKVFYEQFAVGFNDEKIVVSNPERMNKLKNSNRMDPNELSRINIKRDGEWFKNVYKNIISSYRKAMEKWLSGTGGGPGAPENYSDWRTRDDWEFQKYDRTRGNILAWMYMKDKALNFILDAKNNDLPGRLIREGIADQNGNKMGSNYRKSPTGGMFGSIKNDLTEMHHYARNYMTGNTITNEEMLQINLDNIKTLEEMRDRTTCPRMKEKFQVKIDTLLEAALDAKPTVIVTNNSSSNESAYQRELGSELDSESNTFKSPNK